MCRIIDNYNYLFDIFTTDPYMNPSDLLLCVLRYDSLYYRLNVYLIIIYYLKIAQGWCQQSVDAQ